MSTEITIQDIIIIWISSGTVFENKCTIELSSVQKDTDFILFLLYMLVPNEKKDKSQITWRLWYFYTWINNNLKYFIYFQTAAFCQHKLWDYMLIRSKKITVKLIAIQADFKKIIVRVENKTHIAEYIIHRKWFERLELVRIFLSLFDAMKKKPNFKLYSQQ